MWIQADKSQIVFCQVSPDCTAYLNAHPVWCLYPDGSFSRQYQDSYFRSPARKLRKYMTEFTIADLWEIIHGNEKPY